jgi:hypothetical protein
MIHNGDLKRRCGGATIGKVDDDFVDFRLDLDKLAWFLGILFSACNLLR